MIHPASSEKAQCTANKALNIKYRAKINIGKRFNTNLRRKMTQSIHLASRCRNENSSMMLKKTLLIINA